MWRHDPRTTLLTTVRTFLFTLLCPLFPVLGLLVTVAILSVVYAAFGIRRWTVLLAYPAMIVQLPLLGYALARRTFVRGGRRYCWHGTFDVRVDQRSYSRVLLVDPVANRRFSVEKRYVRNR